jgi:GNAT superfamily N-acetyltransferase
MLVTTTYLEQTAPTDLRPAKPSADPGQVVRVAEVSPEFCRFLFTAVGGDWYWIGRLAWTFQQWTEWLSRPGSETWVLWLHGTPAGYVELDSEPGDSSTEVQIAYFGLLPAFIGRGLGGQLLTEGIRKAWSIHDRWPALPPTSRVWVHTCTLDGEHALANYQARGLRPYRTDEHEEHHNPTPPGPWPGAR